MNKPIIIAHRGALAVAPEILLFYPGIEKKVVELIRKYGRRIRKGE